MHSGTSKTSPTKVKANVELAIQAENLGRSFRMRQRESGLWAAAQSFVKPEWVVKTAVHSASFQIPMGRSTGLVGANGAGKTTLMKMIAGLLHPSEGSLEVLGFQPALRSTQYLKQIGMVMGQKSQLWVDIPAYETFELLASIYGLQKNHFKQRLDELTTLFQVEKLLRTQVRRLSLGERMKLEICAALLHSPRLVILDEPTIGLDIVSRRTIRQFIRNYNEQSASTILLSSHDMTDITEVCDDIILIDRGSILYQGSLKQFHSEFKDGKIADSRQVHFYFDLASEVPVEKFQSIAEQFNSELVTGEGNALSFRVGSESLSALIQAIISQVPPLDIRIDGPSLENIVHSIMDRAR